jgi:hypothetical protein
MRRVILYLLFFTTMAGPVFARPQSPSRPSQKPDSDRFGMTCTQILKMTSAEWIAYFHDKSQAPVPDPAAGLARAIAVYEKCFDARTDSLAFALAKSGKGPTKAARADFAAFEASLKDFAAKALANAQPPADSQKTSYASLYEKLFRYQFYQDYEAKTVKAVKPAPPATKPPLSVATPPAAATPPPGAATSTPPAPATAQERARSDADPVTMAKNRFGRLLEVLPDDKMHDLHRAFADVIGPHHISEATRLAVYRYAIFILEPPSATPFSQPPF